MKLGKFMKLQNVWIKRALALWMIEIHVVTTVPCNLLAVDSASALPPDTSGTVAEPAHGPRAARPGAHRSTPPKALAFVTRFRAQPTDAELFAARIFDEPLVPTGKTSAQENKELATALMTYFHRQAPDEQSSLTQCLDRHPASPWRASLLLNLGLVWRQTGYFSRALEAWEQAWALAKSQQEVRSKAMADRIVGELAQINAWVGRFERLEPLFEEIKNRPLLGGAAEQ